MVVKSLSTPVIYKAIFGNYDSLPAPPPLELREMFRFVLLSNMTHEIDGWESLLVEAEDAILGNRHCKMFPWLYFEAEYSFYLDGHAWVGTNFVTLADRLFKSNHCFSVLKHRAKGNVASEFIRCIDNRRVSRNDLQSILDARIDFEPMAVECGFIFRRHSSELVRAHAAHWWEMFKEICMRDQIFVNEAARKSSMKIHVIEASFNDENDYLVVGQHRNARVKLVLRRLKFAFIFLKSGFILQ